MDRQHLPFVFPEAKLDLYPSEEIVLPTDQQPPKDMPQIAWSNSGELVAYADVKEMRPSGPIQPGEVLPPAMVKELRRGYYSAVSHMDDQVRNSVRVSHVCASLHLQAMANFCMQAGRCGNACARTD
eukprot:COSAG02_NODE_13650_length_1367_cov_1.042587_2_plen_126_part_01